MTEVTGEIVVTFHHRYFSSRTFCACVIDAHSLWVLQVSMYALYRLFYLRDLVLRAYCRSGWWRSAVNKEYFTGNYKCVKSCKTYRLRNRGNNDESSARSRNRGHWNHESSDPMNLKENQLSTCSLIVPPDVFKSNMLIIVTFSLNIVSRRSQRRLVSSPSVINSAGDLNVKLLPLFNLWWKVRLGILLILN